MKTENQRQQEIRARCYHPTGRWEEFNAAALEQSVVARFETIVARYPDRLALQMGDERLTYQALNRAVNRLAHAIIAQRGRGAEALALLFEQSIQAIVAMLAVWKAGKFFIAINPADPPARLAQLVQDGCATAILTTRQQQATLAELKHLAFTTILVDELPTQLSTANLRLPVKAADLACIIYTSGSTGQPKGVVYNQRNVLYRAQQLTNLIHASAEDRTALVEYYSVSAALRDTFMMLLNGGALFLYNLQAHGTESFVHLLRQAAITIWSPMVTTFRTVGTMLHAVDLPQLRLIGIGGETLHRQDIELYQQCTPTTCILSTALGSSETVGSIVRGWYDHQSKPCDNAVAVGLPVAEVEVHLLDSNGDPVPTGEIGEIVVRSSYLAQGYWQQPALTAKRFLPDPQGGIQRIYRTGDLGVLRPDGQLIHLGRKDQQVKIRGHRVEIPEVEQTLVALKRFSAVAVVARPSPIGGQQLIAYLTPANATTLTVTELRHLLQQTLPDYMIPTRFVFLAALPLTIAGKVNRNALPDPDAARPTLAIAYHAPRTPLETQVAGVWCAMLGLDKVGIQDHFLELGGNSLIAFQIIGRLFSQCQISIPIQHLLAAPTVADMALVITQHQAAQANDRTLQQLLHELESLPDTQCLDQPLPPIVREGTPKL